MTEKLFELKRKLAEFLRKHPELKEFQKEYENHMEKAGSKPENRLIFFKLFLQRVAERWRERLNK